MGASDVTPQQKREAVIALISGRASVTELAREHQVSVSTLYNWRDAFLDAGLQALNGRWKGPDEKYRALEDENERLKQMVGDYALANYALKKVGASAGAKGGKRR